MTRLAYTLDVYCAHMSDTRFDRNFLTAIRENACSGMFSDLTDGNSRVRIWSNFKSTGNQNILGVVRTVEIESVITSDENLAIGLPFLDLLNTGDVFVVKGADNFAYFGEMMANLAMRVGVVGALVFGASRDSRAIEKLNFPLFATSFNPIDIKGRGRVKAVDVSFFIEGYEVAPFSWVFADSDGVVCFPADLAEDILANVSILIDKEKLILKQIAENVSGDELARIHEGF